MTNDDKGGGGGGQKWNFCDDVIVEWPQYNLEKYVLTFKAHFVNMA